MLPAFCIYTLGVIPPLAEQLLAAARAALEHACCDYSNYAVGAAVRARKRDVATGCNIENVSYGLTMCAERNAIAAAALLGTDQPQIDAIAIVAGPRDGSRFRNVAALPCGACLQVLAEFAGPECSIFCGSILEDGTLSVETYTLGELLPRSFGDG
jgi:cytidine deaminase